MPGSGIIDLAIGVAFFFGVTAALSAVFTELIARFLGLRGTYLLGSLRELLDGTGGRTVLRDAIADYDKMKGPMQERAAPSLPTSATSVLLGSPILRSQGMVGDITSRDLAFESGKPGHPPRVTTGHGKRSSLSDRRSLPSYISATSFCEAIIDLLVPDARGPTTMTEIQAGIDKIPDRLSSFKAALEALATKARNDIGAFRTSVEHWYDDQMDLASGWYKRHVTKIMLIVGAILVLLLNINVITIGRTLYASGPARPTVSPVAARGISCPVGPGQQACLTDLQAQLSAATHAGLPIGWAAVPDCAAPSSSCNWLDQRGIFSRHGGSGWQLLLVLVGFLITMTALVPGARMCFSLLGMVGSLRASGPKPTSSLASERARLAPIADDGTRLYELFLALFRSEAELRRFLVLDDRLPPEVLASQTGSLSQSAFEVARALQQRGLIDGALFAALEQRSPQRSQDIEDVARFYGVGTAHVEPSPDAGRWSTPPTADELPPEVAEFARQLEADLEAMEIPDESERALDPDHWPWTAAAAVLGSFQPMIVRPLAGFNVRDPALLALADFAFTNFDGSWVLRQEFRIPCLQRLREENLFTPALDANQHISDLHRDLIRRLLDGWEPTLAMLGTRELEAIGVVAGWLEPVSGMDLHVNRVAINAAVERRLLLDPLRALVGRHFQGRTEELVTIRNHIQGVLPEHILLVQGPGGIGKTSLMGKVLLDLEAQAASGRPVSFAYIDFDRAHHDPQDPIGLVEHVARQLRLLYATAAEASQFAALEALSAGTDLERAAEILQVERSTELPVIVDALAERLLAVQGQYAQASVSLVLVLDTFEEVQIKGPGAAHNVLDLIRTLQDKLPDMRVIVAGRGVVRESEITNSSRIVILEDLDPVAADVVLEELGVADPGLRMQIVEQFGRNPLTLRLAARALADTETAEGGVDAVVAQADALAKVSIELVQGFLYSRILGHIADPDVLKVAYPGLAVRRVTVEVLREVLAKPCGFDPQRAEDIFERLRDQVGMFDLEDPGTLRHRQDLRRLMLRTMRDEPRRARTVSRIHRRAAAYYASKTGREARAEQLYHRLMGGEDPRSLDELWTPSLKPLLASAMEEPLPLPARGWLSRRLDPGPADERSEWEQEDWEADAASRASSWLASNLPERCLAVLSERPERLPGSRLYALEIAARLALGDLERAGDVLERGLRSAIDSTDHTAQLELMEQAITLRARQQDGPGVAEVARSIVALTDLTGQQARGTRALTDAVEALQQLGLNREAETLNREISRRFSRFSREDMRRQPELVRRVLQTTGRTDSTVLVHAALQVGDLRQEHDAVFIEDSFVLQRLLRQTSSDAQSELEALAKELGLPENRWDITELAGRAIRFGRTGKAIALGLNYASDEPAARLLVVDNLVRPPGRPSAEEPI